MSVRVRHSPRCPAARHLNCVLHAGRPPAGTPRFCGGPTPQEKEKTVLRSEAIVTICLFFYFGGRGTRRCWVGCQRKTAQRMGRTGAGNLRQVVRTIRNHLLGQPWDQHPSHLAATAQSHGR